MAGVQNTTARQIDLRGRNPGKIGDAAICTVVLNPGFNVVKDEELAVCMKNKHVKRLQDFGVIVVGTRRTREDDLVDREVQQREKATHQLERPARVASLAPGLDRVRAYSADTNTNADDDSLSLD